MAGWKGHLNGAHILNICPWEVASLLGALVVPQEPAQALGLLHAPLLVALHGQQRGLADRQEIPRLQIQVLLLVLGERVEGTVLKTLRRHFERQEKIKMAAEEGIRWRTLSPNAPVGYGYAEIPFRHQNSFLGKRWWDAWGDGEESPEA